MYGAVHIPNMLSISPILFFFNYLTREIGFLAFPTLHLNHSKARGVHIMFQYHIQWTLWKNILFHIPTKLFCSKRCSSQLDAQRIYFLLLLFARKKRKTSNERGPQRLHGCVLSSCWSCTFPTMYLACKTRSLVHTTFCCCFTNCLLQALTERKQQVFPSQHCYPTKDSRGRLRASRSAVFQCLGVTSPQSQVPQEGVPL